MSKTIDINEAQANLKDIIHRLEPGEEITITENGRPVATLIGMRSTTNDKTPLTTEN